jgi:hypothetical protein
VFRVPGVRPVSMAAMLGKFFFSDCKDRPMVVCARKGSVLVSLGFQGLIVRLGMG